MPKARGGADVAVLTLADTPMEEIKHQEEGIAVKKMPYTALRKPLMDSLNQFLQQKPTVRAINQFFRDCLEIYHAASIKAREKLDAVGGQTLEGFHAWIQEGFTKRGEEARQWAAMANHVTMSGGKKGGRAPLPSDALEGDAPPPPPPPPEPPENDIGNVQGWIAALQQAIVVIHDPNATVAALFNALEVIEDLAPAPGQNQEYQADYDVMLHAGSLDEWNDDYEQSIINVAMFAIDYYNHLINHMQGGGICSSKPGAVAPCEETDEETIEGYMPPEESHVEPIEPFHLELHVLREVPAKWIQKRAYPDIDKWIHKNHINMDVGANSFREFNGRKIEGIKEFAQFLSSMNLKYELALPRNAKALQKVEDIIKENSVLEPENRRMAAEYATLAPHFDEWERLHRLSKAKESHARSQSTRKKYREAAYTQVYNDALAPRPELFKPSLGSGNKPSKNFMRMVRKAFYSK